MSKSPSYGSLGNQFVRRNSNDGSITPGQQILNQLPGLQNPAANTIKRNGITIQQKTKILSMSPSRTLMSLGKLSNESTDNLLQKSNSNQAIGLLVVD